MSSARYTVSQSDPAELLEVFDAHGGPTGRAKPRAAIHVDGDWHLAFHCWVVRNAGAEVVLQRRAMHKDTFGGYWDAAAAGHWRFGESPGQAAREIEEELGIRVNFDELVHRGRERSSRRFDNGLIDREFHEVYVLGWDRPLMDYRPDPREVIGLASFAAEGLVRLLAGSESRLEATEAICVTADGRLAPSEVVVERNTVVPYTAARLRRMLGSR